MIVLILSLIRAPIIVLNNLRAINFSTSELCLFLVLGFFFLREGGGDYLSSSLISIFQTIERDDFLVR